MSDTLEGLDSQAEISSKLEWTAPRVAEFDIAASTEAGPSIGVDGTGFAS